MIEEQTITVTMLTKYIKQIFEAEELLFNISVVGEISGFKLVRGIAYFDLKDENSLISCVCFNGENFSDVKSGDKVIAKGTPSFYVKGGKLNFNVSKISPFGLGDIFQKFLELKNKLEAEGLFDAKCKLPIPKNVKKIGVITSPTGAVIQDIITVSTRRNPSINIVLYPAKVQGAGSSESIISGLDFFEEYDVDAVIIARGGGSAEDLNEFNNESLARRIFSSKKCIVSAVGHETDFTICDFVADIRGATPSAGAELVVEDIASKHEVYNALKLRFKNSVRRFESDKKSKISFFASKVWGLSQNLLNEKDYEISLKTAKLNSISPLKVLSRGYALLEKNGEVVASSNNLLSGDEIKINLNDGSKIGVIK